MTRSLGMNRTAAFGMANLAALLAAYLHCYHLSEKSVYRAAVYFVQSRLCSMLLGTWGLFWVWVLTRGFIHVAFGPLRLLETEVRRMLSCPRSSPYIAHYRNGMDYAVGDVPGHDHLQGGH